MSDTPRRFFRKQAWLPQDLEQFGHWCKGGKSSWLGIFSAVKPPTQTTANAAPWE
jgi:hypothetical protein